MLAIAIDGCRSVFFPPLLYPYIVVVCSLQLQYLFVRTLTQIQCWRVSRYRAVKKVTCEFEHIAAVTIYKLEMHKKN